MLEKEESTLSDEEALKAAEIKRQLEMLSFKEKVKNFLWQYYTTASNPVEASFHYTTLEIWEQLQQLFPSASYGLEDVALWLNTGGFKFYDFGKMKFEWLINKL